MFTDPNAFIFKHNDKSYQIVEDPNVTPANHCDYCDFNEFCESYVETNEWFPCGAVFSANNVYLEEIKN